MEKEPTVHSPQILALLVNNLRATLLSFYLFLVPQPTESVPQELECVGDKVSPGKNWVEHTAILYKYHNQKQQCSKS